MKVEDFLLQMGIVDVVAKVALGTLFQSLSALFMLF